jgi:hypothetical protein
MQCLIDSADPGCRDIGRKLTEDEKLKRARDYGREGEPPKEKDLRCEDFGTMALVNTASDSRLSPRLWAQATVQPAPDHVLGADTI